MPYLAPIKRKKFEKFLEYVWCELKRQKGDHLIYEKQGFIRPVVIPTYKTIPVFIIKNNLRTAKISREEYLQILRKS